MVELLALRGARPELLEDASLIHRLFAVVEALDVLDAAGVQELVSSLLGVEPGRFQTLHALADQRGDQLLRDLGLVGDADSDWADRLWLRLQMGILGHLFDGAELNNDGLSQLHHMVSRSLFGRVPLLMRFDEQTQALCSLDQEGPRIALDSSSSTIARSVRLGERSEIIDRSDQAVADRQVMRLLGSEDAVCYPLPDAAQNQMLGVLVFALDEDIDQEAAMSLYAEELGRHLARKVEAIEPEQELLRRYRGREEKRLREIVHEANNPLAIVNNYLHILRIRFEQEPEAVDQLRLIGNELDRASEILHRVRELSDIDDSATEPAVLFADVNLGELVGTVVELHRGYAADHDVAISANQAAGRLVVSSDSQRLAQILNNLVRNAIEAAAGRSVMVGSAGGVFREGREGAVLTVTDTGPGLPRDVLERLTEPKQTAKGGDHAGLGLHIVHRLVAELKGNIDVQTAPDRGTTFTVFLPLAPL
jgi:signal transduction histidine kinase